MAKTDTSAPAAGWARVQSRAVLADAPALAPTLGCDQEFAFLGEPLLVDGQFYVNVYTFEHGRVHVLRGGLTTAQCCVAARIRHGTSAVFTIDRTGSLKFIERLPEQHLDLPKYNLMELHDFETNSRTATHPQAAPRKGLANPTAAS